MQGRRGGDRRGPDRPGLDGSGGAGRDWNGLAGSVEDWRRQVMNGLDRQAWLGVSRLGLASSGGRGKYRSGRAGLGQLRQGRQGTERSGRALHDSAWQGRAGMAVLGVVRPGAIGMAGANRLGRAGTGSAKFRHGKAGEARTALVWKRKARRGVAGCGSVGRGR